MTKRPDAAPPPSDAAPDGEHRKFWLRWCRDFFIIEVGIAGPHVPWLNELLKAHPEDAPGGPWEAHKWADFPTHRGEWAEKWWTIIEKGSRAESVHFTQTQAIAVRDALNRLKEDKI